MTEREPVTYALNQGDLDKVEKSIKTIQRGCVDGCVILFAWIAALVVILVCIVKLIVS